ncbi:hypothetical protein B0I26_10244 [Anoxybacillus vitaminiphilus]|uniref:Uncharacterized protein n=1 Tax=Paranoxybacillus vitaminiphilus TaxID=581036 RepID=A0A327YQU1_9BACL|nr:hypothetical protein [Anoxybacillus vitaminiphilus]RAK22065.1 hypothetical protein B0I26_10244 [Anoxybacillus vitaminiphilus]
MKNIRKEYKEIDEYYRSKEQKGGDLLGVLEKNGLSIFLIYLPFWLIGKILSCLFSIVYKRIK